MKVYQYPYVNYDIHVCEVEKSEIDLIDLAQTNPGGEVLENWYKRQTRKPAVALNGSMYQLSTLKMCFNLIQDGNIINQEAWMNSLGGVGIKKSNPAELAYGLFTDAGWKDYVSGYPMFLEGKGPITKFDLGPEIEWSTIRTIVGWNDTKVICVVVETLSAAPHGFTRVMCSQLMYDLGCTYAINLDGGASSKMYVNGSMVNSPKQNRSLPNIFAIYLKNQPISDSDIVDKKGNHKYFFHTIAYGDTYWGIAQKYLHDGARYKEIQTLNNTTALTIGTTLKILNNLYVQPEVVVPVPEPKPNVPVTPPTPTKPTTPTVPTDPADNDIEEVLANGNVFLTHIVENGETLLSISKKYLGNSEKYNKFFELNNIKLNPGQIIKIPADFTYIILNKDCKAGDKIKVYNT